MPDGSQPDGSGKVLYVVSLNPEPGYEDKFNEWYNQEHLPELLACPGFEKARRLELIEGIGGSLRYLALYQMTGMDAFRSEEYTRLRSRQMEDLSPLAREVLLHRSRDLNAKYREIYRLDSDGT